MTHSIAHRTSTLLVILTISSTSLGQSPPATPTAIHERIAARGIGKGVRVRETNGTTVTGTISAIDVDSFQVTSKDGVSLASIRNDNVVKVEKGGIRRWLKLTITIGVAVVLIGATAGTRV